MSTAFLPPQRGPFIRSERSVSQLMREVLLALCPGALVMAFLYGPAVLFQIALGITASVLAESAALSLRKRPVWGGLGDLSAVLTGTLLALSIPPLAPWWIIVIGACMAILLGKHVYGGLGQNPFNPAMLGFALLMLAYPRWMTLWPGMRHELPSDVTGLGTVLTALFGDGSRIVDAITRATPLSVIHENWRTFGGKAAFLEPSLLQGWILINVAYLAGGVWLAVRKTLDPRIPLGFLGGMAISIAIVDAETLATGPSGWSTLFLGSTMLGAFFIATDPVTAASTARGRWIYAVAIGSLVVLIRRFGSYPDGLAFAVLVMNFVAPTIDRLTRPRTLGYVR